MTALTNETGLDRDQRASAHPLLGFAQFFVKERREWWASRRAVVVAIVTTLLVAGTTVAPWLQAAFPPADGQAPAAPLSMDPTVNLLGANWNQWLTFIAIFASMGLLAGERDKGTLAWSLSKPLSRSALLLAKWSAGTLVYGLAGVILPMVVGVGVATAAYGSLPDLTTVVAFTVAILTIPALYIALSIALGTHLSSQAAVAGIGVAVSFLPSFVGLLSIDLARAMPPAMSSWALAMAGGVPVGLVTPIGWVTGMAVIGAVAYVAFTRAEL